MVHEKHDKAFNQHRGSKTWLPNSKNLYQHLRFHFQQYSLNLETYTRVPDIANLHMLPVRRTTIVLHILAKDLYKSNPFWYFSGGCLLSSVQTQKFLTSSKDHMYLFDWLPHILELILHTSKQKTVIWGHILIKIITMNPIHIQSNTVSNSYRIPVWHAPNFGRWWWIKRWHRRHWSRRATQPSCLSLIEASSSSSSILHVCPATCGLCTHESCHSKSPCSCLNTQTKTTWLNVIDLQFPQHPSPAYTVTSAFIPCTPSLHMEMTRNCTCCCRRSSCTLGSSACAIPKLDNPPVASSISLHHQQNNFYISAVIAWTSANPFSQFPLRHCLQIEHAQNKSSMSPLQTQLILFLSLRFSYCWILNSKVTN